MGSCSTPTFPHGVFSPRHTFWMNMTLSVTPITPERATKMDISVVHPKMDPADLIDWYMIGI